MALNIITEHPQIIEVLANIIATTDFVYIYNYHLFKRDKQYILTIHDCKYIRDKVAHIINNLSTIVEIYFGEPCEYDFYSTTIMTNIYKEENKDEE